MEKQRIISIRVLVAAAAFSACAPAEGVRYDGAAGRGGSGGASGFAGMIGGDGGSGGVELDAGNEDGAFIVADAPADVPVDVASPPDRMDVVRDVAPLDLPVQTVIYTNHCARVHWTAGASVTNQGDDASDAIDGRPSTRWSTGRPQVGNEIFEIDFGGLVRFNQVVLDNRSGSTGDYPRGYRLSVSNDRSVFVGVLGPVAPVPGATVTMTLPWAMGRYARITQTGADGTSWWSVHEIRFNCQLVNAPPVGAIDPYDPAGWKATASSSLGGSGESNAFDNNMMSRWTTSVQQRGTEWFLLDLGASTLVGLVLLDGGGSDEPARYVLELSADNTAFTPVAMGTGSPLTRIQFAPKTARYIRILQTGMAANPWSIAEITVKP